MMPTKIENIIFNINNFKNRKKIMLEKLKHAIQNNEVDTDILPHLDILNSLPFCFTTSSCSGRIALIDAPLVGPKYESKKAFRWHSMIDLNSVWEAINSYKPSHILWLKFDSFIISFSVSSITWAMFFIKLARYINLKDSGIRSINPQAGFVNMDFMSTEKISAPIKTPSSLLVSYETLSNILDIANFLMIKNRIKLNMLRDCLELIKQHISDEHMTPPRLQIFQPIVKKYRAKIEELRNNEIFVKYEYSNIRE